MIFFFKFWSKLHQTNLICWPIFYPALLSRDFLLISSVHTHTYYSYTNICILQMLNKIGTWYDSSKARCLTGASWKIRIQSWLAITRSSLSFIRIPLSWLFNHVNLWPMKPKSTAPTTWTNSRKNNFFPIISPDFYWF